MGYTFTMPEITKTLYVGTVKKWRDWLAKNYQKEREIWLILPHKNTGKPKILYNDSVEEALCFGWIDSTVKNFDANTSVQRFTPRQKGSPYSQTNKERLRLLVKEGKLLPKILEAVKHIINEKFEFSSDILKVIQANKQAWHYFQKYSDTYKRIRLAYIEDCRKNPQEYQKRLNNFIRKTAKNKQFGYGGIEKYF